MSAADFGLSDSPDIAPNVGADASGVENFAAGAGKAVTDAWLGIRQVLASGALAAAKGGAVPLPQDKVAALQDWQASLDSEAAQKQALDKALTDTSAGFWGNVAGQMGMMAPAGLVAGPASAVGRLGMAALSGAVQGAIQPTTADQSRAVNTGIGATLGPLGQFVALGLVKGAQAASPAIGTAAGDATQAALDWAAQHGIPMSWAQRGGTATDAAGNVIPTLGSRVEAWLARFPGSRGWYEQLGTAQKQAVDDAINGMTMSKGGGSALQAAGEGKFLTLSPEDVQAASEIPARFAMLPPGMQPKGALSDIASLIGGNPGTARIGGSDFQLPPSMLAANPSLAGSNGLLPPAIPMVGPKGDFNNYQALRSQFGRAAFAAGEGTPEAEAYSAFRNVLDGAAVRSLGEQGVDPAVLQQARNAYQVQKLLTRAEVPLEDGSWTYNPQKAGALIAKGFQDGSLNNLPQPLQQNLSGLMNFARVVRAPDTSGTAENTLAKGLATLGVLGGLGEVGLGGSIGHLPAAAAGVGLGMYALPWLVNRGLQRSASGQPLVASAVPDIPGLRTTLAQLLTGGAAAQAPALAGGLEQITGMQ